MSRTLSGLFLVGALGREFTRGFRTEIADLCPLLFGDQDMGGGSNLQKFDDGGGFETIRGP